MAKKQNSTTTASTKPTTATSAPPVMQARRPMAYAGQQLDRDQLFLFKQQPHDERLERLGYVARFTGTSLTCGECGAKFASAKGLEGHGAKRHNARPKARPEMLAQQPGESDFDFDRRRQQFEEQVVSHLEAEEASEEARLNREAPLNWDKTAASMAGV